MSSKVERGMIEETGVKEATVKKVWLLVDQWLEVHTNESFDLDTICRQLEITERENRNSVARKLAYEVSKNVLDKNNKIYRSKDNTIINIDWVNAIEQEVIDFRWPIGHEDNSHFSFEGHVTVSPGDLIVLAGVSNTGKTAMALNILWDNMDFHPCTLMGNEYQAAKFKRRVAGMTWANPLNEDGTPKFRLIERYDGWKDIINPNHINIIDWINLDNEFWQIGSILQGIRSVLKGGIGVICLQKDANKPLGLGGGFSQHLASIYLAMDFERVTCVKAKEWKGKNPNGQVDGFTLVDAGTKFHNIRPIKKCPKCYATCLTSGKKCDNCFSRGWVDVSEGYG